MGRRDARLERQANEEAELMPTVEQVEESTDVEEVLRWNRFLPSPRNDDEIAVINAVVKRLAELRAQSNDAYVAASKSIGW